MVHGDDVSVELCMQAQWLHCVISVRPQDYGARL